VKRKIEIALNKNIVKVLRASKSKERFVWYYIKFK